MSARIQAPAAELYDMVSDVTRVGEWSPECRRAEWLDGASRAEVGSRFRGWNRWKMNRWSRRCEIVEADPGRQLAFRTIPGWGPSKDSTTWRYRFEPDGDATVVTQSYEITIEPRPVMRKVVIPRLMPHHLDMRPHMQMTLEALKAAAERRTAS